MTAQEPSFTLRLRRSRGLIAGLVVVHLAALAVVLVIALAWWAKAIVVAMILASAWRNFSALSGPRRVEALTLHADGRLGVTRHDGSLSEAALDARSTVSPLLTVLNMRLEGGREALVLLPDALAAEDFRRLRVWLRWRAG